MFTEARLDKRLPVRGLGSPLHFYETIGSTNDRAADLARQGSPHGTLVVADEQTQGRGRAGRVWNTAAGTALAYSLVLRPAGDPDLSDPQGMNVLGALAVVDYLRELGAQAGIKWPNDVLLAGRKVAGVLAEASWMGDRLEWIVLGTGVNIRRGSVPPRTEISYPAISLDQGLGRELDRGEVLVGVLDSLGHWLGIAGTKEYRDSVLDRLAFLGEQVEVSGGDRRMHGTLEGIDAAGRLELRTAEGKLMVISAEEFQLVPRDFDP